MGGHELSTKRSVNDTLRAEGREWGDVCYSIALGVLRVLLAWLEQAHDHIVLCL